MPKLIKNPYKSRHELPDIPAHPLPRSSKWMPDFVPVLTAADMCVGRWHNGVRHCVIGWGSVLRLPCVAYVAAYRKANGVSEYVTIGQYNDLRCKTNAERAAAVNAALRELGYTHIERY